MKHYKYLIFSLFGLLLFSGCEKEKFLDTELETFARKYDVNSTDPVFKYVSEYFFKHDNQLILDPVVGDYVYNFDRVYKIKIVPVDQDQENLLATIDLVEELFLDKFSDVTKKKFFPKSLIIADSIYTKWNPYEELWEKPDMFYSGRHFLSIVMNDDVMAYSDEEKEKYSQELFNMVVGDGHEKLGIDEGFYKTGEPYFMILIGFANPDWGENPDVMIPQYRETALKCGFVNVRIKETESFGTYVYYPTVEEDIVHILNFMNDTPESERNEIFEKYPMVKYRVNLAVDALKINGLL